MTKEISPSSKGLPQVISRPSPQLTWLSVRNDRNWEQMVELDTPAWFEWLQQNQSFRYLYPRPGRTPLSFTVRPEQRGQKSYWQAFKSIAGRTTKKYLGLPANVTKAKLDQTGAWFAKQVQITPADQNERFFRATVDLMWLVERLQENCADPKVAQYAQWEVARIKREYQL